MVSASRLRCALALLVVGCGPTNVVPKDAGPLDERPDAELPRGFVWGVAELHSHPAIHLAFAGDEDGTGGTIWGHPGVTPDPSGVVPVQPSCDAETHLVSSPDQVQRATRALVFRLLSAVNSFPHSPYAGDRFAFAGGPGFVTPQSSWPHGRDLFHQQMHIEAIRRAYEGGLRLMVASATDNRTLSLFFRAPVFPGPPAFRREEDRESAERQLRFIHDVVARNSDWMEIVTTPQQARTAIEEGRLAVVISLEMDALSIEDVEYFYDRWSARHIIPIHLADNDVGGTAAFNDLFNSHSALQSVLLGAPTPRYVAVEPSDSVRFRYGWLMRIGAGIANFEPAMLRYEDYRALGYEPLPLCSMHDSGVAWGYGHRNAIGLRDAGYIHRLMELGMIVDVAHMGERALEETFRITDGCALCDDEDNRGYPLMDSHTGMFPDDERRPEERDLSVAQARRIVRSGGVIGYGTRGEFGHFDDGVTRLHPPTVLFRAVGGPLARLDRDGDVVFRRTAANGACLTDAPPLAPPESQLTLELPAPPETGTGYVRIEPCAPGAQGSTANDPAIIRLGPPSTAEDHAMFVDCMDGCAVSVPPGTRSVTVGWVSPEACRTVADGVGDWEIAADAISLRDGSSSLLGGRPSAECAARGVTNDAWFTLSAHRPAFTIATFSCDDEVVPAQDDPPYCNRCGSPSSALDAGVTDAGAADAGTPDAGGVDAGRVDASVLNFDAGLAPDGGAHDGGSVAADAGTPRRSLCDPLEPRSYEADDFDAPADIVRVTVRSSPDLASPNTLRGATSTYVGSEVCARLIASGAPVARVTEWLRGGCPVADSGEQWFSMNRGATWGGSVSFSQYVLVEPGHASEIEGIELMLEAHDGRWTGPWSIEEILVEDIGDPVLNWAQYYTARLHEVYGREPAGGALPAFALGTDINGLAPQFPISSCHPGDLRGENGCTGTGVLTVDPDGDPVTPPVQVPRPPDLRFRAADGSIVRMRFDERGMGGFGMIPDLLQLLSDYGQQQALDGLFRSAEATIRMWERIERWRQGRGCEHP